MDDLIQLFVTGGGKPISINPTNRHAWLLYANMDKDDFRKLDEIGFVFVKTKRHSLERYDILPIYKTYLWGMIRICVDKQRVPVYKDVVEIIFRAKPPSSTLKGK